MNPETKYKYEILREINPEDILSDIKACLSFKSNKQIFGGNYFMKKGLVYGLSIAGVLVLAGGVTAGILLNGNNSSKYAASGENSIVTMEVNPSISFSVNEKNVVTAVSGENNEGKMIILEESFKGLPLEEAIEKAITIENETGYIVSGSVEANENNIKFTVNVDNEKAKELGYLIKLDTNGLMPDKLQTFIEDETSDIALTKSMGLGKKTAYLWNYFRVLILVIVSVLIGGTVIDFAAGKVISFLIENLAQISNMVMVKHFFSNYVASPLILLLLVILAVYVSTRTIKNIEIWSIRNE